MLDIISKSKRVVIKIGTSLIVEPGSSKLKEKWLRSLTSDIAELKSMGKDVVIVTSGSVALGRKYITSAKKVIKLEEKQAAAACGQPELINKYKEFLSVHDVHVAQVLLTLVDSETRRNYLNAKNTIETLLANKVVPIINENDTVATEELRFGDNDRIAARVAQMVSADLLILLSDVDGLYTGNPRINAGAKHIAVVDEITKEIEDMAEGALSGGVGSGGMVTKIAAAKIAVLSGCAMLLASGKNLNPISSLNKRTKFTIFKTQDNPQKARKKWIASSLNVQGEVIIDDGAVKALQEGKSLLPAGVIDIAGKFDRGDTVVLKDSKLTKIGVGIIAYASEDAMLIKGQQSQEIENIVGFAGRRELIHRDNLVMLGQKE